MMNAGDTAHLSSALQYQFKEYMWVIFVTTDEAHILSRQKEILQVFELHCSRPEWALDFHRDITRMKPPVDFYRETGSYTGQQKQFGEVMKRSLGLEILHKE